MGAMDRFLGGANGQEIPVGYRWTFANSTARAATNDYLTAAAYASTDIGKEALQQSDNTLWLLTGTTPTWTAIGQATTNASLLTSGTVADARLSANVPLIASSNTFTSSQTIEVTTADAFTIDGSYNAGHKLQKWTTNSGAVPLAYIDDAGNIDMTQGGGNINCRGVVNMAGMNTVAGTVTARGFGRGAFGAPTIYDSNRLTGQTAACVAGTNPVATFTPSADGTFIISANVLITTRTTFNFTVNIVFTDETNTPRSVPLNFSGVSNSVGSGLADINTDPVYCGIPSRIRAKGGTAISVVTTGTFTSVVYNIDADITQVR